MSTQVADSLSQIKAEFEKRSGLRDVDAEVKSRSDGDVLILYVAHPTNRLFRVLQDAQGDDVDAKVTIKRRAKLDSLHSAEGRFLLRTLTESLDINRFSFADDFFSLHEVRFSRGGANHFHRESRGVRQTGIR